MKTEQWAPHTVLVVADDPRILLLAQSVLARKGHRVLVADDAQTAVQLLTQNNDSIHSVAVRADMRGHDQVQDCSLRQGAKILTLQCAVNDHSVMLEGLRSGGGLRERRLVTWAGTLATHLNS